MNHGIQRLLLSAYRNYPQLDHAFHKSFVALYGDNGVGKTNILEALSMLSTGRGLRGARLSELTLFESSVPWQIGATLATPHDDIALGCGLDTATGGQEKRYVKIAQQRYKSPAPFLQWLNVVWVVPAMTRLFQETGGIRRRFIDRFVASIDVAHTTRVNRYEHYMRERNMLLKSSTYDPIWVATLEHKIAEYGVAIAASRQHFLTQLNNQQETGETSLFPKFFAQMQGTLETWLNAHSALEAEELFRAALKEHRLEDAHRISARVGVHRSELHVTHLDKQCLVDLCSTGEQKIILLAIIIAFSKILLSYNERATLLLLDDVVAHLDDAHRRYLFAELMETVHNGARLQIWMTGTKSTDFRDLIDYAQMTRVHNATLEDD